MAIPYEGDELFLDRGDLELKLLATDNVRLSVVVGAGGSVRIRIKRSDQSTAVVALDADEADTVLRHLGEAARRREQAIYRQWPSTPTPFVTGMSTGGGPVQQSQSEIAKLARGER